MNFSCGTELTALGDLLQTKHENNESEHLGITPASIVSKVGIDPRELNNRPIGQIIPEDPKAIWKAEEVAEEQDVEDFSDTRPRPAHEILYKQNVMTEDVYLGMSGKDPSSAFCDAMVVKVDFPNHQMKDIDLDVTKQKLVAESSSLKLSIYLPHPVHHKDGKAAFNPSTQQLSVTLPIIRDEWKRSIEYLIMQSCNKTDTCRREMLSVPRTNDDKNHWTWDEGSVARAGSPSLRNRIVARSAMGTAFYLFSHQVGGHKPFLRSAPGEVCKPAIPTETLFYKSVETKYPRLKPFVPAFLGTIDVDLNQEDEETKAQVSEDQKFATPAKRKRKRRDSTPRPAEFSYHLWEKLSRQISGHEDTDDMVCEYIVLEDLTQGYRRPCVLDIKMGTRQHGVSASPEKATRHTAKCKSTTSYELGLRLCGMQIYRVSDGQYMLKDKHWGRALKKSDLLPALELYFHNGESLRFDALRKLSERLKALEKVIRSLAGVRFWGASLLLIYEGDTSLAETKVDVRIIDFAHCYHDASQKTPDDGYLKGLRNLIQYFEEISAHDQPTISDSGCYLDVFPDE